MSIYHNMLELAQSGTCGLIVKELESNDNKVHFFCLVNVLFPATKALLLDNSPESVPKNSW